MICLAKIWISYCQVLLREGKLTCLHHLGECMLKSLSPLANELYSTSRYPLVLSNVAMENPPITVVRSFSQL